jgi:hypothetical protein
MEMMSIQCSLSIVHKTPSPKYTEQTEMDVWLKWKHTCFASMKSQKMYVCVFMSICMCIYTQSYRRTYMFVCTHIHTHTEGVGINVNNVGKPLVSPGEFDIN